MTWQQLNIKIDLQSNLSKKILIEKHNSTQSVKSKMFDFLIDKFDNCELFLNTESSDSVFFIKILNDEKQVIAEKNSHKRHFYISGTDWDEFSNIFSLSYDEIKENIEEITEFIFTKNLLVLSQHDNLKQINQYLNILGYKVRQNYALVYLV